MLITDIYLKYNIPPNLQEHMKRVFGFVCFLEKHWVGKYIDWEMVKKLALVHDLGNIVKFDFDKFPDLLGDEKVNVKHWKEIQKQTIEKYGSDDHEATIKMLHDIGFTDKECLILSAKSFGNSINVAKLNNWPLKILYYADLRVLPSGVGTLEERIKDIKTRMPKYSTRPDFDELLKSCRNVESQIQKGLSVFVNKITNNSIDPYINLLHKVDI
jgi:hypothetical protein